LKCRNINKYVIPSGVEESAFSLPFFVLSLVSAFRDYSLPHANQLKEELS